MDDIVIIHHDKKYLKKCLMLIEDYLNHKLDLELNRKKTSIVSIKEGFVFLGYNFRVYNDKTIIKIKNDTIKKVKKRVRKLKYLYDNDYVSFNKIYCSLNTYLYSFKYASNVKVVKIVNKYFGVD